MKIKRRYEELDLLRGLCVVYMLYWHIVYDIVLLFGVNYFPKTWFWSTFGPNCARIAFYALAGASIHLAYAKHGKYLTLKSVAKRSALLLGIGMLITIGMEIFDTGGAIYFGTLHALGSSIFLAYFFIKSPHYIIWALGGIICGLGYYFMTHLPSCYSPALIWLYPSSCPTPKPMVDYFPLLPWFGVTLLGLSVGRLLYPQGERRFTLSIPPSLAMVASPITFLGRHSLAVYIVHQPLIYLALYAWNLLQN